MPQNGLFFWSKMAFFSKKRILSDFSKNAPNHPDFAPGKFLSVFFGHKRSNFELDGQDFVHNATVFSTLFGRFLAILEEILDF